MTIQQEAEELAQACDTLTNLLMIVPGLDTVRCAVVLRQLAAGLVENPGEWVMTAPDGTKFTGPTPLKAALPASKYRLEIDPVAAKKFMEVMDQVAEEGEKERERCMRDYGTLNCPSCGGSGHIADAMADALPGWKLVPAEPTPEIIAAAATAVWPTASLSDIEIARKAAPLVLMKSDLGPGFTVETLAAAIATMAPAYRAMVTAAQESHA